MGHFWLGQGVAVAGLFTPWSLLTGMLLGPESTPEEMQIVNKNGVLLPSEGRVSDHISEYNDVFLR